MDPEFSHFIDPALDTAPPCVKEVVKVLRNLLQLKVNTYSGEQLDEHLSGRIVSELTESLQRLLENKGIPIESVSISGDFVYNSLHQATFEFVVTLVHKEGQSVVDVSVDMTTGSIKVVV